MRTTRMRRGGWMRSGAVAGMALLVGTGGAWAQAPDAAGPTDGVSVIYLVRHAERAQDHPQDPTLSDEGDLRAVELARLLANAPLTRIFSTQYRRTMETAAPTAQAHGLEVESYDPRGPGLQAVAEQLRTTPGHHLVVGHSNTTPQLVAALGGDPVSAVDEMEYDRLYLVVVAPTGEVTSTLLRFGAPFHPEEGGA